MNPSDPQLDYMMEAAIREKGAIAHLKRYESSLRLRQRRIIWMTVSIAACLALFLSGAGLKLGHDARSAGYAFNPVEGQMGGSEITALMQEGQIPEALKAIASARASVRAEILDPSSDDPAYALQLQTDEQELALLEAVCYMRQSRWFKSRKMLRAIAREGGAFSAEAEMLLEQM